jgi:signal transduction histidine kinase
MTAMRSEMSEIGNVNRVDDQATVLIIADNADFARTITARWQAERTVPMFTLMTGDLCPGVNANAFDMAIVGDVRPGVLPSVLTILESTSKPVLFVAKDAHMAATVRETHTRTLVLCQQEAVLDAVILVATEALRGALALARARGAEQAAASNEGQATLGRYMLEMRHTLNDALTSMLGNSELLLAEPGALSAKSREQLETIRHMAIRMHEILQRFSSLETELRYVEKQAAREARARSHGASACL